MIAWRLTRSAHHQQLDGEGARLYGGRWSSEGVAVAYMSSTLSLAALEYLVHIEIEDVPSDLVAMEIELPENVSIQVVDPAALPSAWSKSPDHPGCVHAGDAWIAEGRSLLLRVPSAIIPSESNLLFNPGHSEAETARVISSFPFHYDPRLLG
jgi:RES domain-containing protein